MKSSIPLSLSCASNPSALITSSHDDRSDLFHCLRAVEDAVAGMAAGFFMEGCYPIAKPVWLFEMHYTHLEYFCTV